MRKALSKKVYVKEWRAIEKVRKRHNRFITEYVRVKFWNVYNEANSFFNALNTMYPQKLDLRRTKEFKRWKEAVKNTNNPEANIIVQTLHTTVSYRVRKLFTGSQTRQKYSN